MSSVKLKTLPEAVAAFPYDGEVVGTHSYGHGHVHNTFCVYTQKSDGKCKRYILQRLSLAFKSPENLMENIVGVTDFLGKKIQQSGGDVERETLCVIRTNTNDTLFVDSENRAWRLYKFIENAASPEKVESPELFYESARAFGRFQELLSDYPAHTLHETIERFHDTENRLKLLFDAVKADKCDRVKNVTAELDFVNARIEDCSYVQNAVRAGLLPLRVTHNDTKLNNVMIDDKTNCAICVIDLDTVMMGLSINDFGDAIRYGANHSDEDERDLSKVNFDVSLYEVFKKGFIEGANGNLTEKEIEYLPWGAKTMTLECGIRFLTDYLDGDNYFRTTREGQNLDRARTQFKLVSDMERLIIKN